MAEVILLYAYFKGKIDKKLNDKIIIDVNNIGYEIFMPESDLASLEEGMECVKVYTHFAVREDDMRLFGFLSNETLNFFKKLISVSGVGPKAALGIISNISVSDMCVAIATENILTLKSVPGIGPKMAQKIIFELKDKVLKEEMEGIKDKKAVKKSENSENIQEAITALQVLGYTQKQIKDVLVNLNVEEDNVENIIRKVLKEMQNI